MSTLTVCKYNYGISINDESIFRFPEFSRLKRNENSLRGFIEHVTFSRAHVLSSYPHIHLQQRTITPDNRNLYLKDTWIAEN